MSRIKTFLDQLKERGVRKTLTIYMSSALTAIGIVKLLSEAYGLSPVIFPVVVTFLAFGLISAFFFAWLHGKEGAQMFQLKEIVVHSILFAVALFVSFRIAGAPRQSLLLADSGEVPSIAILYLKNLGLEADEPYSYGITQDLIVDIAKAGLVRVAAMKDVLSLQTSSMPIDSIALKLRVRYVLDGSIKRIGDMLQLSGQIVEAATGITLWADRLQTKVGEAAILQGQLARAIINALNLKPSDVVKKDITKSRTTNPESYEFYLRAKYLFEKKKTKEDIITARGMYEKAIDLDSAFVLAHLGKGDTHISQGEYEQAKQIYKRALHVAQQSHGKNEEASSLSRLGVVEWYQGNYPKALEYYSQSLKIIYEIGDRAGEGETLKNIGLVYHSQGDYAKALEYYSQSLKTTLEIGDRAGEGRTLNNIGNVYNMQGDYSKALDYYTKGLKVNQELGDRAGEGRALNNIGLVYFYQGQGDYATALDYYTKSLRINQELGDRRTEGLTLSNIGIVYYIQGDYAKALDYFTKSLKVAQELGNRGGEGIALANIGLVYHEQGNYSKTLDYCTQSLKIFQELGDQASEGSALSIIGVVYYKQANYRKAIELLKKSVNIFAQIDEKQERMSALSWLAVAEAKIENRTNAQAMIDSVEELFRVVPKPDEYIRISWNLYQVNSLVGNQQKATQYLERAYKEVTSRAERISDKVMRQSYLTNVKTNREVITAWKKLSSSEPFELKRF